VSRRRRPDEQSPHGLYGRRRQVAALELVDDRFDELATELRDARPAAPVALRARVAALDASPAVRGTRLRLPSRRLVLGLAAAVLVASFVAAGVTGLGGGGSSHEASAGARGLRPVVTQHGVALNQRLQAPTTPNAGESAFKNATPAFDNLVAPAPGRLQRYDATMRLRVKDVDALSNATKQAMDLTRGLGGYVASVQYGTSGGRRGGATFVLRVPVGNVQTELAGLTRLGTILQQRTGVLDVTKRVDREAQQIARLRRELATAGPAEAVAIRHRLQTLRVKHARLLKSARFAHITLALTTPAKTAAAAPSRLDRALGDAGSVLLRELEILLYALVVAGPLLLLGAAGVAAARTQRRRADARLLERA
jgi:hypothetical protein